MSKQQGKYELLKEDTNLRRKHTYIQSCLLVALCGMSSVTVYATWTMIYRQNLVIPPTLIDVSSHWRNRIMIYEKALGQYLQQRETLFMTEQDGIIAEIGSNKPFLRSNDVHDDTRMFPPIPNTNTSNGGPNGTVGDGSRLNKFNHESTVTPSSGNYIYSKEAANGEPPSQKIVCYYTTPLLHSHSRSAIAGRSSNQRHMLLPENIDPNLCTHINIGIIEILNNTLYIDDDVRDAFERTKQLRRINPAIRILLWVGGASVGGFSSMVENHASRKMFILSLKALLERYNLDGVDLDWEFPDSGGKRRMHFSQLLHEIRREYQREHRTYILSVAVAPQETIAYMAYDVGEINKYADYVNLMTYDYHFYSLELPQTGLNAPLYRRANEHSLLGTLNINESVHYWLSAGLERSKLVLGLPTYGHSFKLVNPFNTRLGAPANNYGSVGTFGFASYSEICWFRRYNIYVHQVYDVDSCSPYLYAGNEWISYEDEQSLECKAKYIKAQGFAGAMIFSLNTDDFGSYCAENALYRENSFVAGGGAFPLLRKVRSVLLDGNSGQQPHHTAVQDSRTSSLSTARDDTVVTEYKGR